MRRLLIGLAIVLLAVPVGAVVTFLLWPCWDWIERTFAIESLGHSGPATWCFAVTYGLVVLASAIVWRVIEVRRLVRRSAERG